MLSTAKAKDKDVVSEPIGITFEAAVLNTITAALFTVSTSYLLTTIFMNSFSLMKLLAPTLPDASSKNIRSSGALHFSGAKIGKQNFFLSSYLLFKNKKKM